MRTAARGDALALDWGSLGPLRLRARALADGVYAGQHRSVRRGAGIEFGGHRPYVPGDDLRWLDRRAMLRHDRLVVREFETETDRSVHLVVDATASMAWRGARAPGAKLAYAALLGAGLARVALASGDPVGVSWIGGAGARPLSARAGREAFDRTAFAFESVRAGGDATLDARSAERAFEAVARGAKRGAIVVFLSDLVDLPPGTLEAFASLGAARALVAVQVLDPDEATFPFHGNVRLRAAEGDAVVETDADATRARYLAALGDLQARWSRALAAHGGELVVAPTDRDPLDVLRAIVGATAGRRGRA